MPNITTCPTCGNAYDECSEKGASSPERLCTACFRESREIEIAVRAQVLRTLQAQSLWEHDHNVSDDKPKG